MPKRVLVVEDDAAVADLIAGTLRRRRYDVKVATSAEEGVAAAKDGVPDVIFVSLLLQGSNGLKVCKALNGVPGLSKVPVVMLISYAGELEPKHMTTIGVVGVLVKPLKEADILGAVRRILGPEAAAGEMEELEPIEEEEELFADEGKTAGPSAEPDPGSGDRRAAPTFEEHMSEARETAGDAGPGQREDDEHLSYETDEAEPRPAPVLSASHETSVPGPYEAGEVFGEGAPEKGPDRGRKVLIGVAVLVIIGGAVFGGLQAKKYFLPAGKGVVKGKAAGTSAREPVATKDNLPEVVKKEPAAIAGKDTAAAAKDTTSKEAPSKPQMPEKKTAAAAPPKGEKAAAEVKSKFSVQVGVFVDEKNAAALVERLKKKGFDAFILKETGVRGKDGKTINRVLVGRFEDRRKAAVQATALEKEGIKSIVFSPAK